MFLHKGCSIRFCHYACSRRVGRGAPGRIDPGRSPGGAPNAGTPTQENFHCVSCGHTAHADTVGALNVLRAGLVRREAQPA
ncbi:zinc ribbon domain-containing protein [Streptomyces sp. NPDC056231]|uniref:zinc ribbon domain-containing protein n=1 Tax=Streptomyces sp. NPDC056231 TaxID=3345755 RepID=UPI003AAF88E2